MLGCKVFRHKKHFHHSWTEYWPIPWNPPCIFFGSCSSFAFHLYAKWIPNWRGLAQEWNIITLIRVQTAMFWFMVQNPSKKADSFSSLLTEQVFKDLIYIRFGWPVKILHGVSVHYFLSWQEKKIIVQHAVGQRSPIFKFHKHSYHWSVDIDIRLINLS